MGRWIVRILFVFFLLLSSGIALLWIRSYFVAERFRREWPCADGRSYRHQYAEVRYGGLVLQDSRNTCVKPSEIPSLHNFFEHWRDRRPRGYPYESPWFATREYWRGVGFQYIRTTGSGSPHRAVLLVVPCWLPLLVTLAFPTIVGFRYLRRRRRERARGFPVQPIELH